MDFEDKDFPQGHCIAQLITEFRAALLMHVVNVTVK